MGTGLNSRKTRGALRQSASISLQLLLVLLATWVALRMLGGAWSVIWPVVIALLLTTLTWPPVRFLRRHSWPPALAAGLVTLLFLVVAIGTIVGIAVPVGAKSGELADQVVAGITELRQWAEGPPLKITDTEVQGYLNTATDKLQASVGGIATATLSGVSSVVNGLVNTILALFLMFFFLKDGPRFLPWLGRQLPGRLSADIPTVAGRCWETRGSFVRSQALVGLLDAVLIGIGLAILGVDLALPLAVLTFITAFIPIVGALFAGFAAAMVALAANGLTHALLVVAATLLVQQVEGNLLQPLIVGRAVRLHPVAIIVAVATGAVLWGIAGAFIAVPTAAVASQAVGYLRNRPGTEAPP
jgi:predicted PurR-regulated permease PerM